MNEWAVFGVIVALLAYTAAVVKPLLQLNTTITTLTTTMQAFEGNFQKLTEKNSQSHDRIWNEVDKNTERLDEHETRITVLEMRKEKNENE